MTTPYTPQLHRLLGTPVTLDLGITTGLLSDIKGQVVKLDTVAPDTGKLPAISQAATVDLPKQIDAVKTEIGSRTDSLLGDVKQALNAAANDIVQRLSAPAPAGAFEIGPKGVALVRLLVQAQAYAIAKVPGAVEGVGDENVAMAKLRRSATAEANKAIADDAIELRTRCIAAFDEFSSKDLAYRSARLVEMHALVRELALHLQGQ